MLNRIFPKQFDNNFRGNRLAIWLFALIMFMELSIAGTSILDTRSAIIQADRIPLDNYGAQAAAVVITLFIITGLFRVLFAFQGVVALIRYRAMIPFMYLLFLILHLGSKGFLFLHPYARTASTDRSGYFFILAIIVMLLVGFGLSLLGKSKPSMRDGAS